MDSKLRVDVISRTAYPNQVIYLAMHQDYSEEYVFLETLHKKEHECGDAVVRHLLMGNRGHYGPLEHPQIIFNGGWFPHSVMQQARTHRIGVSWDVQSFRYTGSRILKVANGELDADDVFYLRPVGEYRDRVGNKVKYTEGMRGDDLILARICATRYAERVAQGMPFEMARGLIPFDTRQHFVVSFNVRSLMHFLDMRSKADAQLEIQWLCELLFAQFALWVPEIAVWYTQNRWGKARLAP